MLLFSNKYFVKSEAWAANIVITARSPELLNTDGTVRSDVLQHAHTRQICKLTDCL